MMVVVIDFTYWYKGLTRGNNRDRNAMHVWWSTPPSGSTYCIKCVIMKGP